MEKCTTPEGRNVFIQFRIFPTTTSVDITVYQYGKMFYISFIIYQCQKPEGYEKFPCLQVAGNYKKIYAVKCILHIGSAHMF